MNCRKCSGGSCWDCGYRYGKRLKRRQRRAEKRRRSKGRAVIPLMAAVAVVVTICAAWTTPGSVSMPVEYEAVQRYTEPTTTVQVVSEVEEPEDNGVTVRTIGSTPVRVETPEEDYSVRETAVRAVTYTQEELETLALIIYQEAGSDACTDDTRLKVGNVVLNRVADQRFPDTIVEVATAEQQYGRLHWTGLVWPETASQESEAQAVERAYDIAKRLLLGERVLDADVVWQAEFTQGTEIVFYQDEIYFCR